MRQVRPLPDCREGRRVAAHRHRTGRSANGAAFSQSGGSCTGRSDHSEQRRAGGYRTVAWLLGFNKNTVQRIFQIKGWQVRKRPIGMRPRIEAVRPEPVSGHLSSPARHAWAVSNPFGSAFCAGADGAPRSRRNPDAGRPMRVDDDARHHRHARADADGRRAGRDVHAGWAAHPWRAKAARRQSSPMPPEWRG